MTTSICFYFQVHQPFRLRKDYSFFSIGPDQDYEDHDTNRAVMQKVAKKCYLPANKIMLDLITKYKGKFRVSYSISGMALEQFELYAPEVIESFQKLVATGCVELISETYYHSLAFLKSKKEFIDQVKSHRKKIIDLFDVKPETFRNTELIYNNQLAQEVEKMGYKSILAEGVDRILGWRSPNYVYSPPNCKKIKLLLKNYKLSDDIAFRFSNTSWAEYPLTSSKYAKWIHEIVGKGNVVNLFLDYETFGEHHWDHTGIFKFLEEIPAKILSHPSCRFQTPKEIVQTYPSSGIVDVQDFTSWADQDRDLSAWMGNSMQTSAIDYVYSLEKPIKATKNIDLIHTWRKLLTSDHSYYKSTKGLGDGAVHNYFSPFDSPHDAYIVYTNVINDLKLCLENQKNLPASALIR